MTRLFIILALALAGCANVSSPRTPAGMQSFAAQNYSRGVARSNVDIAADIIDLSFALENGQRLPVFTRFETPVRVGFVNSAPRVLRQDLQNLIARIRNEAGIDIAAVSTGANINIDIVNGNQMRGVENKVCFIAPNVESFAQYRKRRSDPALRWENQTTRNQVLIVIPDDATPQVMRDCLHEELAQALGPLNDLYHLSDSVFNDDDFHLILTPFDMLVLRALYSDELQSGMTLPQVAARLPNILAALNPRGRSAMSNPRPATSQSWANDIRTAQNPNNDLARRLRSANSAVNASVSFGYGPTRQGFAQYLRADILADHQQSGAAQGFAQTYDLFKSAFGQNDIHTAHASVQMASLALSAQKYTLADAVLTPAIASARRHENATLLVQLLALRASLGDATGNFAAARNARAGVNAWGQYAFGNRTDASNLLRLAADLSKTAAQ
ncbi:hypothetical protein BFP76_03415 [Amylibacter kogurei]|uniref:ATP-dependent transcriptional regulator n=1 Tax=Paramylibacter kogurei TaxID=1889778 RepID=A0A2G5K5I1_9RHOB|nr:DUF2927 domain-containing protein [Amylibacter kogurei]PIB24283.1 hypothetical protein BFP76_03415 [Amylibacter kogurei]